MMNKVATLSPWPVFEQDEIDAVAEVLASGKVNYWTGNNGREFEREFADHCDAKHAVALGNGTQALELALEAAGIHCGHDVIVTPRTFIASASCAVRLGARPVFADVSPESQNLTPESVEAALTPNTKAIIAVHHAGWPCDMDALMSVAQKHDLVLIEDCAQAHGARYKGRPVGGLGHVAAFSFCQDKIMTTGGEGGMLVTDNEAIWKKAWAIKDHGKSFDAVYNEEHAPGFRWLHRSFGTNMRMTEMQAVIGRIQLKKLADWNRKRSENALRLAEVLSKCAAVTVPLPDAEIQHAFYRLYAFVDADKLAVGWDRDRISAAINARGVPCFIGSCPEIYEEQAFAAADLRPKAPMPNAASLGPKSLAFLVHPTLTDHDVERMCDVIQEVTSTATP
jgi:dTDP-4-amino-4,6-dideoxygalactose transaminase